MSKSDLASLRLCFHQRMDLPPGGWAQRHRHDFWQVECLLRGRATVSLGGERLELRPQRLLWVPPGVAHAFRYPVATDSCSVKFHHPAQGSAGLGPDDAVGRGIAQALLAVVPRGDASRARQATIAGLVQAGLQWYLRREPVVGDGWADRLAACCARHHDRGIGVATAAAELGVGPRHLSERVRSETGASAKAFIDRRRAGRAARMLAWADADIAAVARECGFGDVFTFSRFFKRVTGQTPGAARRAGAAVEA